MVLSKISKKEYIEDINVDPKDLDKDSYIYNGTIYGKALQFVIGIPQPDRDGDDFTFFNIYLVKNEEVLRKIGILEFKTQDFQGLYDTNGDIILDDKNDIMKTNSFLFSNAKTFIKTKYNIDQAKPMGDSDHESDSESESESESEPDLDLESELDYLVKDGKDEQDKKTYGKNYEDTIQIKEHTKQEHLFEVAEYEKTGSKNDLWINKFLKSNKYSIDRVPGDGDCFFSAFIKAHNKSKYKDEKLGELKVRHVREFLSEIADQELLNNYKAIYVTSSDISKSSKEKMSKGGKIHAALKVQIGGTSDQQLKKELIDGARSNIEEISRQKSISSKSSKIQEEFKFMRDINTLEQLKDLIKTNEFYADAWAIPNIEKKYNVKFIILNQSLYSDSPDAENSNVLQCGDAHPEIQRQGFFNPEMYIILNYSGNNHYDLITYDKNYFTSSFKFKELPYIVKRTILETCYEEFSGQGAFSLIEDLKEFARKERFRTEQKPDLKQELRDFKGLEKEGALPEQSLKPDQNEDIVLVIGKNLDKNKQYHIGKIGNHLHGETIDTDVIRKYRDKYKDMDSKKELENYLFTCETLDKEKQWRSKLDNAYERSINIDGKNYKSVEEYFTKIGDSRENKLKALKAKFDQHEDLRKLLLLTNNYLLKIKIPRRGAASLKPEAVQRDIASLVLATELMEVRKYYRDLEKK